MNSDSPFYNFLYFSFGFLQKQRLGVLWVIIPLFLFLKLNIGKRHYPYGILFHICMHPVGLCEKVSSFRIKAITTARKARWLSVALKVTAGTL